MDSMQYSVINLDRTPHRLLHFEARNAHMPEFERFSAVDGREIDRAELVRQGLIAADLDTYDMGQLGCAMSHIALWKRVVERNRPMTICEDDAILHRDFTRLAAELIASVPHDWDFFCWGWNFCSSVLFDLMDGVSPCMVQLKEEALHTGALLYPDRPMRPMAHRLRFAIGTPCYAISPRGARKLLEFCLPLRPMRITLPHGEFDNTAIDVLLNQFYPVINAYINFPPLAITRNDRTLTTNGTPEIARPIDPRR